MLILAAGPDPKESNTRTKKRKARSNAVVPLKKRACAPQRIEYVRLPKHWFTDPVLHALRTPVRPPTMKTRRKQAVVKMGCPKEVFFDLMKDIKEEDVEGIRWRAGKLLPTAEKNTYFLFKYKIGKPSVVDKFWSLERSDKKKGKKSGPFRRGHGCARLHLSRAAAGRGERTDLIAQVTGNVIIELKVPKEERAIPKLSVTFAVSSMDKNGHVNWPTKYSPQTAAALRKQMRHHVAAMMAHPEYPTLDHMGLCLTQGSNAVLLLK